jgi:predicted branched-subunit amino acid permease
MLPLDAAGSVGRLSASSILLGAEDADVGAATDALETETGLLELVFVATLLVFAAEVLEEADFVLPWLADAVFESAFAESAGLAVECAGGCVIGLVWECAGIG